MRGQRREDQFRFGCGVTQVIYEQHAAMRKQIAMDQRADIVVPRNEHPIFPGGLCQQGSVFGVHRALGGVDDIVTGSAHRAHRPRDDVGVGQDAHAIRRGS